MRLTFVLLSAITNLFLPRTHLVSTTRKLRTTSANLNSKFISFANPTPNLTAKQLDIGLQIITAAHVAGYGGTMIGLYSDWYSNYPQTNFHFFNDNREWNQVDKVGHAYSAYVESSGSMEIWRYAGISRKQADIGLGGLSGIAFQTIIETLDGFSQEWGWSWGDYGANIFGSGLLIGQELAWNEQRIHMKFSTHKKNYGAADLNARANEVYGKSVCRKNDKRL